MSITLKNVTHTYMTGTPFERTAIKNISLSIEQGEFVAIIGHTGSGKSTLVQHLNGLLAPSVGQVNVDGIDLHAQKADSIAARRNVGMVFQYPEYQLFEETIAADIAFGPRNFGLDEAEIEIRVREAMDFADLDYDQYAERSPFQLSGGQMRRVAIAGVIALKPRYLILDEPAAGLDPIGKRIIFDKIKRLHENGTTVILVSHNMDDVAQMADRILVMHQGVLAASGTPKEIFAQRALLQDAGLDVPPVTETLRCLKEHGLAIDDTILDIEEAAKAVLQAVRGNRHAE
ncbi:MAG: energy-coupling factor transporter ATPase [Selenomonadales bacterium]|nr:energy-coupling factor transporter ATPase [Selenomonadales bacterium]